MSNKNQICHGCGASGRWVYNLSKDKTIAEMMKEGPFIASPEDSLHCYGCGNTYLYLRKDFKDKEITE